MRVIAALCLACLSAIAWDAPGVAAESSSPSGMAGFAHLDEFCDPYPARVAFPILMTPQWVGEAGVDAVVVLAIDDMRGHEKWEAYLRPILDRLKRLRGRAAVSIMTCDIEPNHPHLQTWLQEGVSLETHTVDHPCPLLGTGGFEAAKGTYDRCVDKMASIPGNRPIAFRTPCCDSRNTPSPRMFAEIIGGATPAGNTLSIDSSVFNVFTPDDPRLPRELVEESGRSRFMKYLPFSSFVNTIENHPYPYVIGNKCWEFPCATPSDWQGQNINKPNSPVTLRDMKASLDATVITKGVYCLVFHPHGWMQNTQVVELIDHAAERHGGRVLFLTFRECLDRLEKNLLAGSTLRYASGGENGVRLMDLNGDGVLDIVMGNEVVRRTRVWDSDRRAWNECDTPFLITDKGIERGVRFGLLGEPRQPLAIRMNDKERGAWRFNGREWMSDSTLLEGLAQEGRPIMTSVEGRDVGLRLRDLDRDGTDELIAGAENQGAVYRRIQNEKHWAPLGFSLPKRARIVDAAGRDAGLRFVDLDKDGFVDVLFSDDDHYSVDLFESMATGWSRRARSGPSREAGGVPAIVRGGKNNGVFFRGDMMWVQNESTATLPDMVDRGSFNELREFPQ